MVSCWSNMSTLDAKETALVIASNSKLRICNDHVSIRVLESESEIHNSITMLTPDGQVVRGCRMGFTSNPAKRRRQIMEFAERLRVWCERTQSENLLKIIGMDPSSSDGLVLFSAGSGDQNIMQHIAQEPKFDRMSAIIEIAKAVKFLHTPQGYSGTPFVHGNIRGENIFVAPNGLCYLGEFGLTCIDASNEDHNAPSLPAGCRWLAPERIHPQAFAKYNDHQGSYGDGKLRPSSDVYSLGSTILEILTGERPYYQYQHDAFVVADALRGQPPQARDSAAAAEAGLSEDIHLLLQSMWKYLPERRCSTSMVCKVLMEPSKIRQVRPHRLAPVFAASAAASARRRYM
ncbi:hypothetical protein HGRIS_004637 [Hohenbuehelia grisea]|uniref:Protein kinase domain-containing protein n=1 Tax=Hohenbuehelia grisea TaxID=104357 RepID=A0ABR3JD95_9AGAR